MRRIAPLACLTLAVAVAATLALAARTPARAGEDSPAAAEQPVRALRYRITVYDSALDYAHQAGREITELWFPGAGIVCNLAPAFAQDTAANAFYGEPRFRGAEVPADRPGAPPGRSADLPTDEIEVPASLFRQVRTLADATRARHAAATALAETATATKPNPFGE